MGNRNHDVCGRARPLRPALQDASRIPGASMLHTVRLRPRGAALLFTCCASIVLAGAPMVRSQSVLVYRPEAAAAFSPDGTLGAFSDRNVLTMIDVPGWKYRWHAAADAGPIAALAFSANGSRLAAAISRFRDLSPLGEPRDHFLSVVILDAATGAKQEEIVQDRARSVRALSWTQDGALLAVVVLKGGEVLLWDVTGDRDTVLPTLEQSVSCTASFSPSGGALAWATTRRRVGAPDYEVRVMHTGTRAAARVARGSSNSLAVPLAFSTDGSSLAFATEDWMWGSAQPARITLFDVASRKVTRTIRTAEIDAESLAFSADGRAIAGTGFDRNRGDGVKPVNRTRRLCLWDAATGKLLRKAEEEYPWSESAGVGTKTLLVPRRDMYVCMGRRGRVSFYDSNTLKLRADIPVSDAGSAAKPAAGANRPALLRHTVSVNRIVALSFASPTRFVSGNTDGTIKFWEIPPLRRPATLQLKANPDILAISPGSGTIALPDASEPGIAIMDAASGTAVRTLPAYSRDIGALAYSPDGSWLAASGPDGTIRIWDTKTWQEKAVMKGHADSVEALAISGDSTLLASGGEDRTIRVWDIVSGTPVRTFSRQGEAITALAFGKDMLAASSGASSVAIWKLGGGNPVGMRGHSGSIYGLAFSPDGATLAGAGNETICLWEASSGKLIRRLAVRLPSGRRRDRTTAGYRDTMTTVAWAPDGSVLVCGGLNNTILLWDSATWRYRMLR